MRRRNPDRRKRLIAAGALLLIAVFSIKDSVGQRRSQERGTHKSWGCLKRPDLLRDSEGRPIWLGSSELLDRVIEKQRIERPGQLGKNSLEGVVSVEVLINKHGKVSCARGSEGHPIAIGAAIHSLRKWTFRPYIVSGKPKAVVGVLTVPYDFGN